VGLREELLAQGCIEKENRAKTVYYENPNGEVVAKVCTKCEELKSMVNYAMKKIGLGGKQQACKLCTKTYYAENRERIIQTERKWREKNPEKKKKMNREYYEENRDVCLYAMRKYRKENRGREVERTRKWREENRGRYLESCCIRAHRRRARKSNLPDDFTLEQQSEVLTYFNNACALTGEKLNRSWDHALPIASGHGGTTYGNMYPLRGDLNSSKCDSNLFEWFESNRQRFNLSQAKFDTLVKYLADVNEMTVEEYTAYYNSCFEDKSKKYA